MAMMRMSLSGMCLSSLLISAVPAKAGTHASDIRSCGSVDPGFRRGCDDCPEVELSLAVHLADDADPFVEQRQGLVGRLRRAAGDDAGDAHIR